jgi:hydrogenase maturation protease
MSAALTADPSVPLVIGVGQEQRGDDAAGLWVARRLTERSPGLRVVEHDGDGMDLLLSFEGAERVVLVDAVVSGEREPGAVHRFDAARGPLPAALFAGTSSHALGVAEAIELARAMERLPERVVVYGIEGGCFDTGAAPGPAVIDAVDRVAERVWSELATEAGADA